MEKRKKINSNRVLTFNIDDDFIGGKKTISEYIEYDCDAIKSYNLSQNTDYEFYAWTDLDTINSISFAFDVNHPIYFPLLHLLGDDNMLIIDDDLTREKNQKYVKFTKEDNKIFMTFVNTKKDENILPKFKVFVENLDYDKYSKIDKEGFDTKRRLYKFFLEVEKALIEKNHQITIEEYIIKKKVLKNN